MSRQWLCVFILLSLIACRRTEPADSSPNSPASRSDSLAKGQSKAPLALCDDQGKPALEAARQHFDKGDFARALSCAAKACAQDPDAAAAHAERAAALTALERLDEAQLAYARALALDPEDLDALVGAAHLYVVVLSGGRDYDELGLLYAERGLRLAVQADPKLWREFALLSAMAYNDLGEATLALERANAVLIKDPSYAAASYERALALFELCRFGEAKQVFSQLLEDPERGAHAHQHLGLLLEREGKVAEAQKHFDQARALRGEDFPELPQLPKEEFGKEVERAVAALPADMRQDLAGISVRAEEIPAESDLTANQPPLSPTILGLFRGPPLGESCEGEEEPCRSVALYRQNLIRAVRSKEELLEQIRVTLLHEVGHLRGEDDLELAARGLE